ncbi:MAG: SCO family protein [Methylococcales bacterium]|nr:SCO family protein [Methylococcales bacterium]MDD5630494.1 SCO family protein [Methylococcales bacterium]
MHNRLFGTRRLKFGRIILYTALTLALNGCDTGRQQQLPEITGHLPDLRFSLMSDTGQPVTNQTYQGYLIMLFFGFTGCQAECPFTLFRLAKIMRNLGDNANRTRILFVTLDPGRDSPQVLHRYVAAFEAGQVIGLTGNETEIEDLTKRYRAAYRPRKSDSDELSHSAAVYVFDPQGRARFLVTPDDPIETVADVLRRLLASS